MKELYELKEQLMDELKGYRSKQRKSMDDITAIKYLASAIDHICNIIDKADEGESGYYDPGYRGSYARDREMRYSRNGYSRHGLSDKLRTLMDESPDERTRMEIKKLIDRME